MHKGNHSKMATTPPASLLLLLEAYSKNKGGLPKMRTSDGLDSNVYKLMKRSNYNFSKPPLLGNIIEAKPYGLNDTQKMIRK